MAEVVHFPTALSEPVKQTRTRGRLPRSIGRLQEARFKRIDQQIKLSDCVESGLRDEVSDAIASWEFDPAERRLLGHALTMLEGKLRSKGPLFDSPAAVRCYLSLRLGALPHEEFGVLFLDSQNRLITFESIFRGTLTQVSVYPREVALRALAHKARSVVLTHNHPSGDARPSEADEAVTQSLKAALSMLDVRVLDHIIVAGTACVSMAEIGLV